MSLIVQKFGGSSVADTERVFNVADIVTSTYAAGNDVVVVVSAQGDTTDDLIEKAKAINPNPSKREMDVLLANGEQISMSLLAMAIEKLGYPVISLTGWQAGIHTGMNYGAARIKKIETERLKLEISKRRIVIVAGFQGINKFDDVTTLGRGGSDTTAVALAAALGADLCQIYTDVDGVYTADPRKIPTAKKLDEITYDEMLELASLGAQVLHNRSVEMGKRFNVDMEVISSFTRNPGTKIKEAHKVEKMNVSGVARDMDVAQISLVNMEDAPGIAYKVFSTLANKGVNVDIILQSTGRNNGKDIAFTVPSSALDLAKKVLEENKESIGFESIAVREDLCKLSIVGAGMVNNPGVAAMMFEALAAANVNIDMISTSEIKVSVLIQKEDSERAMRAVHDKFF
ncbi:MAG: aspartate kinase [Oscillospiraceae bacterium]|nr:aspartate kinase [Oscillospiraceae bacterium]